MTDRAQEDIYSVRPGPRFRRVGSLLEAKRLVRRITKTQGKRFSKRQIDEMAIVYLDVQSLMDKESIS